MDQGFLFPSELIQPMPLSAINPFSYPNIDDRNGLPQFNPPVYGAPLDPLGFGALHNVGTSSGSSSNFGSIHAKLIGRMSEQEIMDAKALAASKSHSEAERRRRERINGHLGRLRSLLPNTTKTDKASLLAEVIQHVKELRRQTSELAEGNPLPTETDELTIDATGGGGDQEDGGFVIKASLCCDDRPDLIPNLAKALKSLKLRTLKAEITTLGSRVKNILVVAGEDGSTRNRQLCISSVREALKATMERGVADDLHSPGGIKRQRTNHLSSIMLRQRTPF